LFLELDLVNVRCTRMAGLHRNKSAREVYRGYLSKIYNYLLPKYIKSLVGLVHCYLYIYLFTDYSSPTENMKLQILILAAALVTIIGPAAGIVYSACKLATILAQCGITTSINDCKCTTPCPIDFN
jgi:hypothetical protein